MKLSGVVIDADALIDLYTADDEALYKISRKITIHCTDRTRREVDQIRGKKPHKLGLSIIGISYKMIEEARSLGTIVSEQDRLCMLSAKSQGMILVSNDNKLRALAKKQEVEVKWGHDLLLIANQSGILSKMKCISIAKKICSNNPQFITNELTDAFIKKLK